MDDVRAGGRAGKLTPAAPDARPGVSCMVATGPRACDAMATPTVPSQARRERGIPGLRCPDAEAGQPFAFIHATVVSSMRLEKPHSLSYQEHTLTRRPETLVRVASKLEEAGSWLKSIDTSGRVL